MINKITVEDQLNDSMMNMAAYALLQRAIPDLRDGFKPVNRRVISSMNINKTTNFTKSATVEGRVMQLHPHGGSYGSIVGLTQKDRQNLPLLVGKGSWGQYTSKDHTAAAARYTEVKLGKNALEIVKELKEKSVNLIPNYDGTQMIPEVLPVTYPTILTQSQDGMAIGFASAILSYNLIELREAIEKIYNNEEIGILYPDFPTGGIILKDDLAANEIMKNGKGSLRIRAKIEIDGNRLIINELPYSVKRETIIDKIVELNKNGKLKEITDVRDGTSFKGMKIVVKARKNIDMQELIAKLYHLTPLETSVSSNMNVLFNGYPVVMGTEKMLREWVKWRESVILISFKNMLEQLKKDLHLANGVSKIFDHIDEVINIIRFEKDELINKKLILKFDLDEEQADFISKLPIRSFNQNRLKKRIDEIATKEKEIEILSENIKDEDFIKRELLDRMDVTIKNIEANPRRTEIKTFSDKAATMTMKIKKELNKVDDYEVNLQVTDSGFIFKSDKNGNFRAKPFMGDAIKYEISIKNDKQLAVLLPDITVGKIDVDSISADNGLFIPAHFKTDTYLEILFPNDEVPHVLLGYDDGQLARIKVDSFITSRTITKNGFYDGGNLVFVEQIPEDYDGDIKITYDKKSKIVSATKSNVKSSRTTRGQRFVPKEAKNVTYELI